MYPNNLRVMHLNHSQFMKFKRLLEILRLSTTILDQMLILNWLIRWDLCGKCIAFLLFSCQLLLVSLLLYKQQAWDNFALIPKESQLPHSFAPCFLSVQLFAALEEPSLLIWYFCLYLLAVRLMVLEL